MRSTGPAAPWSFIPVTNTIESINFQLRKSPRPRTLPLGRGRDQAAPPRAAQHFQQGTEGRARTARHRSARPQNGAGRRGCSRVLPESTVELRLGEKRRPGLQDLIRPPQLGDFLTQPPQFGRVISRIRRARAGRAHSALLGLDPVPQHRGIDAQQLPHVPARGQLGLAVIAQPVLETRTARARVSASFRGAGMTPVSLLDQEPLLDVAWRRDALARALQALGRFAETRDHYEHILEIAEAAGADDKATAVWRSGLGIVLHDLGDLPAPAPSKNAPCRSASPPSAPTTPTSAAGATTSAVCCRTWATCPLPAPINAPYRSARPPSAPTTLRYDRFAAIWTVSAEDDTSSRRKLSQQRPAQRDHRRRWVAGDPGCSSLRASSRPSPTTRTSGAGRTPSTTRLDMPSRRSGSPAGWRPATRPRPRSSRRSGSRRP